MRLINRLTQSGETIVEVLVAIAVIGAVLGSSYAIVSRNSNSYQQASERTAALKLAENQLELIRGYDQSTLPNTFCFIGGILKTSAADCSQGIYQITVTKASTAYEVAVSWPGINGNTETLNLRYKA